ncbi:shikimate kinase AroK [Psychromonas sp. Urea-02u-13]|jgi:shikimate kinase|uniref:shikimate kinase AroK n=1 Tax=Psychromonas sp. Urea-02u-13 TaxID=2058326 RepID=UPI000C33E6FC|nr:shikimate kinase AroK [Psychromonas sp. Urea-02u-13]PKG40727.1 shikimate kinase AroK [Psychromonas sp. Urea-02u-13]
MAEQRNIFLIGPMGAGKSTIGRHLAQMLHLNFHDSDSEIEKKTGADIAWIFDVEGEEGFRNRESDMIDELSQKHGIVLATGGGAVVRPENRGYLSARGIVVYLKTSVDKQLARTLKDKRRPLLQTEDPRNVLETLAETRNLLYDEAADYTIETDEQSAKVVASQIITLLDF